MSFSNIGAARVYSKKVLILSIRARNPSNSATTCVSVEKGYLGRAEPSIGDRGLRALLIGVALVSMLNACTNQPSREDLQSQVEELQSQVEELHNENDSLQTQMEEAHSKAAGAVNAADEAKNAADEVQSQAQRFSFEDWQTVVPYVQEAAGNAVDAAEAAAGAAQEVEQAAAPE